MWHDILYLPVFIKIGAGVEAVLRFCLRNVRGCNGGITDGLGCHDIHAKFHKDWFRHSKVVRGDTHADTST
jgi:hypothetical protein